MKKWFLSVLLVLCMAFALLPVSAMAESYEAQWGVAAADGTKPVEWAGSGTLADAVTYANGLNGGAAYIQLLSDLTATVTFTQGTTTLDLNGCTISGSSSGVITLNSGTLTIADSSAAKNGKVTSAIGNKDIGTINVNGGSLVVASGTVENLYNSTYVHTIAVTAGNVTVNGGKVVRTSDYSFSYAINNMGGGTVSVNGGVVTGGSYAIYNKSGTVNVTDGEVSSDKSIVIFNKGTVSMTGGTVKNNNYFSSNAIYNDGSGSVSIGGGGEVSGYNAIFFPEYSTGTVSVTGGKVIATGDYAIESQGKGSISVTGGEIIGKSCAIRCSQYSTANVSVTGGELTSTSFWTIFNYGTGSLSVTDARVEGKSQMYGAIYHNGKGKFTIGGTSVVTSAYSSSTAGTIYVTGGTLEITGGTVENTSTGTTGNAIYAPSASVSMKSDSPITIKGPGMAMTNAPSLTDTVVKTAATNVNGTDGVETYQSNNITAYKYLEFVPAVAKIGSTGYATVQAAIDAVADDQTITLLKDTTEKIAIPGEFTRYFTLDINGKTLSGGSNSADSNTISYSGGGVLTITDSIGGGKITKDDALSDNGAVVQSSGKGKIIVNGKAEISADNVASFYIAGAVATANDVVLEINGGTVGSPSQSFAIKNDGIGKVLVLDGSITGETGISSTSTGKIIVSGGTIKGSEYCAIVNDSGTVTLKGGTIENLDSDLGEAICCDQITIDPVGALTVKSGTQALSNAPALPEDTTSYQWRTSDEGAFAVGPYGWNSSDTYLEIQPACSVTYHPGANGTGSEVTDSKTLDVALTLRGATFTRDGYTQTGWATSDGDTKAYELGGSYTNNVAIDLYPVWTPNTYTVTYRPGANGTGSDTTDAKTHGIGLTLRGALFTRDGYTQTGWAITGDGTKAFELGSSYTDNTAITLYPVWAQNRPASGGGTSRPADTTVYNDPRKTSATIWLSGSGLSGNDILVTEVITSGSNYNAMLKLANSGDILRVYDISLKSGRSSTGSAMYLTFDLTRQYAGQTFTLVHKKADDTFEYLYAAAGADGKVKFGPIHELSPFMLVKGSLLYMPAEEVVNVPKTGDASSPLLFVLLSLVALCGAGAAVYTKKRRQA